MASDLNKVMLVGRMTRDPELKHTGNGGAYVRFGLANNRNYTAGGERKEEVSFFNCVAWGRQAEIIHQYCKKGKQVAIEGRLQQRSWQSQDGQKQNSVDIVVSFLQMLGSAQGGSRDFSEASSEAPPMDDYSDVHGNMENDDIPF
ncbi:MAG: single-stranded DNA-binding protein [Spirochaetales bacterium]|nr:single-stranded DNA-binding protein [Spirochaetales bacterium]